MKVENNISYDTDEDDFQPSRRSIEFTGENTENNRRRSLCNNNLVPMDSDSKKKSGRNKSNSNGASTFRDKMKAAFSKKK
mmetsp:Transcript_2101/g.4686  ORF Transcript_2101/g.4686 Transcript_2101/m.4686 type:complete len:80 (-) Transcript_2101:139-378(-)